MNKIDIRFLIPIYLLHENSDKYIITEKSFKYLLYLKNLFIKEATINFTILGSEQSLSRDLTLKYFANDDYIEYDQGGVDYLNRVSYETLNTIVGGKIAHGYEICKTYHPDLIIFMKSNHFISQDWLKYVIDDYNPDHNKIYGLSLNYNIFILTFLDDNNIIDIDNSKFIDNKNDPDVSRIDACLIAIPLKINSKYTMNPINLTEESIAHELKTQFDVEIDSLNNLHTHIFNIKSRNDVENVTSMKDLDYFDFKNIDNINKELKDFIIRDIIIMNYL